MPKQDQKNQAESGRGLSLDSVLRFLNVWLVVAALFGIGGVVVGLGKAGPHQYMERDLPGVLLAMVQAQLGPVLANGLIFGLWLAIIATIARVLGGRHRLKLGILAAIWIIATPLLHLALMFFETNGALFGARIIVRWAGAGQLLKSIISFGLEQEPLRFRATAITFFGIVSLILLVILHLVAKLFPGGKSAAWQSGKPSRIAVPVSLVLILIFMTTLGRSATEMLPYDSPEIIFISIDTLRADHLSSYGYERNTSPNLDLLAKEGVLAEHFIAHAPWTLPSHASMFTGLLPYEHGAVEPLSSIDPKMTVFPELLKQKGYRTAAYVTGILVSQKFGFDSGFDVFSFKDSQDAATTTREAAGWFLAENAPSFLFLHLFDLHYPYKPPPELYTHFGPPTPFLNAEIGSDFGDFLRWANGAPEHAARSSIDRYDELILSVDFVLGRFFEMLRRAGRYDNAMIVVVSDHGEEFYEHGAWGHSQHLFDESIRVPLIVKFPRGACAGARLSDRSIPSKAIADLIMSVAGQTPEMNLRLSCGERGVPELLEELAATGPVFSETQFSWISEHQGAHRFSARTTTHKLLEPYHPNENAMEKFGHDWLLFDLANDPGEKNNIHTPEAAAALDKVIAEENEKFASRIEEGTTLRLDDETINRLRSLGYLQ